MDKSMSRSLQTNTYATVTFAERSHLEHFAVTNSERVASMLHFLMDKVDDSFVSDMIKTANDLAYQVQQAVELLVKEDDAS